MTTLDQIDSALAAIVFALMLIDVLRAVLRRLD